MVTRPVPPNLGDAYPADYRPYGNPDGLVHRFKAGRLRACIQRAMGSKGPFRLLDVGCGGGALLYPLRREGWELCGLEPDRACVERLRAALGVDVRQGVLQDRLFDPPFDVVTMIHVLEHVPDPASDVAEVRRLLRPGGAFIVEVPAADCYGFALLGERWPGLDLPRHLTHFTSAALGRLLERSGFRIRDVHRRPAPGFELAALHRSLIGRPLWAAALYPATWFVHRIFRGPVVRMIARRV
ncbi:MAG TPA: class I SAM-dependent methyltransferase [Planctomycetota bacterium]|jgi:SAM-dependent methyltransferase|nr:class I SAM-dependent methyltransferase [Planctomycetota bacterium]